MKIHLSKAFLAGLRFVPQRKPAELETLLAGLLERARAPWPDVEIEDSDYLVFVAQRIGDDADLDKALRQLNAGDLYLACGCALGTPEAASAFERVFFPQIESGVRSIVSPETVGDLQQATYEKLFVGYAGHPPKICHYLGEGALGTWLRVVATRHAIDIVRKAGKERPLDDGVLQEAGVAQDPELQILKQRYRQDFKVAFEQVVEQLTEQERNLLRFSLLDQLTYEQIAAIYTVHRVTVRRWMRKLRDKLLDQTRSILSERLDVDQAELDSIVRLINSELHVSISRLLRRDR